MRIKAIAKICGDAKCAILIEKWDAERTHARQFVGDGLAFYPLDGLPYLTEETLPIVLDIPAKKRVDLSVRKVEEKASAIEDITEDYLGSDKQIEPEGLTIRYEGRVLQPFFTPYGIAMVGIEYLNPFKDAGDELNFYARRNEAGRFWVVAKAGFKLLAAIMPLNVINDHLCEKLHDMAQACEMDLARREKEKEQKSDSAD